MYTIVVGESSDQFLDTLAGSTARLLQEGTRPTVGVHATIDVFPIFIPSIIWNSRRSSIAIEDIGHAWNFRLGEAASWVPLTVNARSGHRAQASQQEVSNAKRHLRVKVQRRVG